MLESQLILCLLGRIINLPIDWIMSEKSLATSGAMASAKIIFRKYSFQNCKEIPLFKNSDVFLFLYVYCCLS